MKISRLWLQRYFEASLPSSAELSGALTFHAFEIESVENDILDVKVTPNRGHDCFSHRGIAKELSAILSLALKRESFGEAAEIPATEKVRIAIENAELAPRYIAGYIRRVKVGPSPAWLRDFLESIGQKSINNIVDATNFVMFDLGQPLHAFDAEKLTQKRGAYAIGVRLAKQGERITALDEKEYALEPSMLVIVDSHTDAPIGIAGIKGGMPSSITEKTSDIIIESANFNGPSVRKTAQCLKLRTDASSRYEQGLSPELCAYGMRAVVALIREIAGGEVMGILDTYPTQQERTSVSTSTSEINATLGSSLSDTEVGDALKRLGLFYEVNDGVFSIAPPFERLDLTVSEDIAEEIGRIAGYDTIRALEIPAAASSPGIDQMFVAAETAREKLVSEGFSEVYTSVFVDKGERVIANKIDGVKSFLRASLIPGLREAFDKNVRNKDLLGPGEVKLFEIGVVWKGGRERWMLGTAHKSGVDETPLAASSEARSYPDLALSKATRYQPFSKYPFIVRDIAMWVPAGENEQDVLEIIRHAAGDLLVNSYKFDRFEKGDEVSLAFRLVFQSFDRTLTDFDANERMASISRVLSERKGFEIR